MTIIGITTMILGYNYLRGNDVFSRTNKYQVNFADATGLLPSNSVVIDGVEIGRVKSIELSPTPDHQVLVTISVPVGTFIPENSKFSIASLDLLGKKAITVIRGDSKQSLKSDIIYQGSVAKDMLAAVTEQLTPITQKADKLLSSIDTMVNDLHTAVGYGENSALKKSMDNISATLQNANKVFAEVNQVLTDQKGNIESIVTNVNGVAINANELTKKIADNSANIENILKNLDKVSQNISESDITGTLNKAKSTLAEVSTLLASINRGEGTLGKIAKDEALYRSIDSTIHSLNNLLIDLKANPKRYVSFSLISRKDKK